MGIYWEVEVGQLAGVSGQTVGEWTRHGYVRASRSTVIDFAYSFEDVAEAIVAHELIDRGVPCEEIRQTIENTREKYGNWPLTAAPLVTTLNAKGHCPTNVLLHLEDADLDIGRNHGNQTVLRYSTLEAVSELLRRGGWAIREHPSIRGRRIFATQVAHLAEDGYSGLRILREEYELTQAEIRDAVRWYQAVRQYDPAA